MKNLLLIVVALFPCIASLKAQDSEVTYSIILTPGDSLRQEGDMYGAIKAYKKSIKAGNIYAVDDHGSERIVYFGNIYNLACAFSKMGEQDSALKYLERFINESKDSIGEALSDPDLAGIRNASGWQKMENTLIRSYCAKGGIHIKDLNYASKLWYMRAVDQAYYEEIAIAEQKTGKTSSVVLALWDLKEKMNEENQRQLIKLLQEKGWPKKSAVGEGNANTAFLIIQHSNLPLQQKYLPVIKDLCKTGEADWQDYALMYDRVQVSSGKSQRYGSQVHYNMEKQQNELFALENPEKVDEWRRELGLQPLSEYLANYNIKWPKR